MKQPKMSDCKLGYLEDLILRKDSPDFVGYKAMSSSILGSSYAFLNSADIERGFCVEYDDVMVDILEFKTKEKAEENKKNFIRILKHVNKKGRSLARSVALLKNEYVVFIYTSRVDYSKMSEFVGGYKDSFGFGKITVD